MSQGREEEMVYTVCCFYPDARKDSFFPLAVLEFAVLEGARARLQGIWWPSDETLRFLESQTNSVLLRTSLLNFVREVPSGMQQEQDLKYDTILLALGKIVGCGNFSFTELKRIGVPLSEEKVLKIIKQFEHPPAYQKIPVPVA